MTATDFLPPRSSSCATLEDALHEADAGEVVDAGGGGGVMDIYLDVADADAAIATATAIIGRLGIENRTKVERVPEHTN